MQKIKNWPKMYIPGDTLKLKCLLRLATSCACLASDIPKYLSSNSSPGKSLLLRCTCCRWKFSTIS